MNRVPKYNLLKHGNLQIIFPLLLIPLITSLACTFPGYLTSQSIPATQTPKMTDSSTLEPTPQGPFPAGLSEVWPQNGSVLERQPQIIFYFNQAMARETVEKALTFTPPINGKKNWVDDATLKFIPDLPLPEQTEIKVNIGKGASSSSGQPLITPVTLAYQTPGALKIVQQIPAIHAINVDPLAPIVVSFNQPVLPLISEVNQDESPAFTLNPQVVGKGEWINTSTYVFYPSTSLHGQTSYLLTLRTDLVGPGSIPSWDFTTAKMNILSVNPDPTQNRLALDEPIAVKFNQPMNRQSVEQNVTFSIKNSKTNLPGKFTWNETATQFTFQPEDLLVYDTLYILTIPANVQSAGGDLLNEDRRVNYTSVTRLTLLSTLPETGQKLVSDGSYNAINFKFSNPLARQAFKPLITVTPNVADLMANLNEDNSLTLSAIFTPDTTYHIVISNTLKDIWGGVLAVPINLTFTTSPTRPSLDIPMLRYGSALFLRPEDNHITGQVTNLSTLMVKSHSIPLEDFFSLDRNDQNKAAYNPAQTEAWNLSFSNTNQGKQESIKLSKTESKLIPGLYFYSLSSPQLSQNNPAEIKFLTIVSQIQLTLKRSLKEMWVWAVDLNTTLPLKQKDLRLLNVSGQSITHCTTDEKGICTFVLPDEVDAANPAKYYVAAGDPGDLDFGLASEDWNTGVSGNDFGINNQIENPLPFVYLYTDRPIYRPGQTVNFRLVVRKEENGRYLPVGLSGLTLKVLGNNGGDGSPENQPVSIPLTLSSYGTASGSFKLPDNAALGAYHFDFLEKVNCDYSGFNVAAYQKPQIDLQVHLLASDLKAGAPIPADISAHYFFGTPAAKLPINWTLYALPDTFPMAGGFQAGKQDFAWNQTFTDPSALGYAVASGSGMTGLDGMVHVDILADRLHDIDLESRNHLILEATIDNGAETPVSARATMVLHPSNFYIGVKAETWGGQAGREMTFLVQTTDWKTNPSPTHTIKASFQKIKWQEPIQDIHSATINYPSPIFSEVSSAEFTADENGQARIAFTPPEPGNYRLELNGEGALTQILVWVTGPGGPGWADLPNQHLDMTLDSAEYRPGQNLKLSIPNPLGENTLALITIERGKVMQSSVVTISGNQYEFTAQVPEEWAPNVFASVLLIGKTPDGTPDFRLGFKKIMVNPAAETLQVGFIAQPQTATSGSDVLLAVQVKDSSGKPVKGQFSISLVDKAALALADLNSKNIVQAFYGENNLGVQTSLSLAAYGNRMAQFSSGGKGGGGGSLTVVRENFADTAYWQGDVETDEQGKAQIQVKLPDNLTTWAGLVRGLTKDTRVGEALVNIVTSKPLLVQPVTPRFAVVGDHIQIGATVFNNTDSSAMTDVTLAVNGLKLDDPSQAIQKVTVGAKGKSTLKWWVTVQDVPEADLIFSAVSGNLSDITRLEQGGIPVKRYETSQTFATVGLISEPGQVNQMIQMPRSFTPSGGELHLEFTPSLNAVVLDGIKNLPVESIQTNEALASNLLPEYAIDQVLQKNEELDPDLKKNLENAIRKNSSILVSNQNNDGGWGWIKGDESNEFTSAYVLLGLGQSNLAGYSIDPQVLQKGREYLQNKLSTDTKPTTQSDFNRRILLQFAIQSANSNNATDGINPADWQASYQSFNKLSPWAEAMLALGLHKSQPDNSQAGMLVNDLMGRMAQVSTGLYWSENEPDTANLSSTHFNTAVVIYALAQLSTDTKTLNEAAHYLVLQRKANGAWNSDYESAWALMALSEVMKINKDIQANFGFTVKLNNKLLVVTQPEKANSLNTIDQVIPWSQLWTNYPNIISINREQGDGNLFYRMFLKTNQNASGALPLQKGMTLSRRYELGGQDCPTLPCQVVTQVSRQQLKSPLTVRLTLLVPQEMGFVEVDDFIPAGVEIINQSLNSTQLGQPQPSPQPEDSGLFQSDWNSRFFGSPQIGDDTIKWVAERVPAGTYILTYQVQPLTPGSFNVIPAHAFQIYYPEVEGTSPGSLFEIIGN